MIVIDGSYGEGGGQILRTSLAFSSLLKIPVRIYNIRKKRRPPGLKPQHFTSVKALKEITNAKVQGLEIGSQEIYFEPKVIEGGKYIFDIGTAGSIPLLLQSVILPLLFSNKVSEVYVKGGTDVKHSPTIDYFRFVILPYLKRFAEIYFEVKRRGYYPRGNGLIYLRIRPRIKRDRFKDFNEFVNKIRREIEEFKLVDRKPLYQIFIYSVASEELRSRKVCEREVKTAERILKEKYDCEIISNVSYEKTLSVGNSLTIVGLRENGIVFGSDGIGEKGVPSEKVAERVSRNFIEYEEKGAIDNHLADNLIPYLALAKGEIQTDSFTNHLKTNIWVVERFLGKIFEIEEERRVVKVI